jgi:hypothetical protein
MIIYIYIYMIIYISYAITINAIYIMLRFLDNAGIGALTAAGEWYHDRQSHTLYMVGNGTHPPPSEAVASQGTTVLRQVSVCV